MESLIIEQDNTPLPNDYFLLIHNETLDIIFSGRSIEIRVEELLINIDFPAQDKN